MSLHKAFFSSVYPDSAIATTFNIFPGKMPDIDQFTKISSLFFGEDNTIVWKCVWSLSQRIPECCLCEEYVTFRSYFIIWPLWAQYFNCISDLVIKKGYCCSSLMLSRRLQSVSKRNYRVIYKKDLTMKNHNNKLSKWCTIFQWLSKTK